MEKEKHEHRLIPLADIDDVARGIAIAWVPYVPYGSPMPEIAQRQKLASDIINYSQDRIIERTKQYQVEIVTLQKEVARQKEILKEFKQWLQETVTNETGPSSKQTLQAVEDKFKALN